MVNPGDEIDVLDLWNERLPVFGGKGAAAKMTVFGGQAPSGEEADAWEDVQRVFDRVAAADHYLITVPMWNAGVPWVLKHLIDNITQPGMVFGFDPASGYRGLLANKRAVVIYTSGVYSQGAGKAFGTDLHRTFFDDWLRFCGIADVQEVRFQPTVLTADPDAAREAAMEHARGIARSWNHPAAPAA